MGSKVLPAIWFACLLLGISYIVFDSVTPNQQIQFAPRGWDLKVPCAAARAYVAGRDPYYVNIADEGVFLPYIYPPIFLDVFAPVCVGTVRLDQEMGIVYPVLGLVIVLLLVDWRSGWRTRLISVSAMVFGGFAGFFWVFKTGNAAFFIAVLLSLSVFCFRQRQGNTKSTKLSDGLGAAAFGFALSLKFILLPVLFALVLLPRAMRDKARLLAIGFAAYLLPMLLSLALHPRLCVSFVKALFGRLPGQYDPSAETYNPAFFWFIRHLVEHKMHIHDEAAVFSLIALAYLSILAVLLLPARKIVWGLLRKPSEYLKTTNALLRENPAFSTNLTFFAAFVIMMLIPRVKEYGYFDGVVLAAPIIAELPLIPGIAVALAAIILPIATNEPRLMGYSFFENNDQVISALAVMGVLTGWFYRMAGRAEVGADRAPLARVKGGVGRAITG